MSKNKEYNIKFAKKIIANYLATKKSKKSFSLSNKSFNINYRNIINSIESYTRQTKYFNQIKLFNETYQINFFNEIKRLFKLLSKKKCALEEISLFLKKQNFSLKAL